MGKMCFPLNLSGKIILRYLLVDLVLFSHHRSLHSMWTQDKRTCWADTEVAAYSLAYPRFLQPIKLKEGNKVGNKMTDTLWAEVSTQETTCE